MTETSTLDTTAGTHTPGAFVWHEIRLRDVAKAQAFYTALFGWTYERSSLPGMEYYSIQLGSKPVGGMYKLQDEIMAPHWGCFISVADVDETADDTKAAGGEVCVGPDDIPGVGRFAVIQDPQGAYVGLYKSLTGDPDAKDTQAGEFCWDQLNTTDMAAGAAFYQQVIGWATEHPAPELGVFKFGELMEASLGPVSEGVPPHWLPFLYVTNLDESAQKAETLGATVLMANLAAGAWGRFSVIQDPAGAVVGLFQGNDD